jgi:GTP pyrophosphokinase
MSLKIEKAMHFAKLAHEGQFRADGVEPYFNHVYRVFKRLLVLFDTIDNSMDGLTDTSYDNQQFTEEDILCAALLHDIIEDTKYDNEDINKEFGYNVEMLVMWLTNYDNKSLNRKKRIDNREHKYHQMPNAAKLIKLADRIDNVISINNKGGDFKDKYIYETIGLIWAIEYDGQPMIISNLIATLKHECINAYQEKGYLGSVYFRDLNLKWQEENKDKVAKYDVD